MALIISFYELIDARLSWKNIKLLRSERKSLQVYRQSVSTRGDQRDIGARIEVQSREYGIEIINRFAMDVFMGFGSVMIGAGTLMAIEGSNHRIWLASNYLSGYVGNAPLAL